jgi:serine phosphatase RsbU (regulator of sigma subunit)
LEGDKRENELKLQSQQLALLTSDKELQNTLINNQKLEKEKTLQALQITESRLQEEQRNRQITDLEKEKELQAITIKQKELEGKERQKAFELVEADRKLKAQELQEEKTITQYSFYVYGLIGIIFMVIAFAFYQKQKVNRILGEQNAAIKAQQTEIKIKNEELLSSEQELRQNNEELLATHETMREQKEQLEIVNTEIAAINMNLFDSIRYAERIQSAMLPNIALFQQLFGGAMIFFKPKDIVSGDFYWAAQVNDMNFVAVADCTGHGVPGAFMSMIGSTLLNEIINQKNIYEPERILRRLNMAIMQALRQGEKENRDGMDICLMRVMPTENENKLVISFCAAKRPLYLVENDTFIELKGDRKSIGGSQNDETEFVDKNIVVSKGTIAYLTTDGLADQNGPKRQKLGSGAVKEFIKSVYHKPFQKQNELFDEMLKDHMKGEKQRDDITVLAVRI